MNTLMNGYICHIKCLCDNFVVMKSHKEITFLKFIISVIDWMTF